RLGGVPAGIASFRHAELEGAAVALLVDDAHRNFGQRLLPMSSAVHDAKFAQDLAHPQAGKVTNLSSTQSRPAVSAFVRRRPACS
ncbi:MAG TPA: hypothetical protein VFT61_10295, partial [Sphingomicrobium sp.]|nr:hypothetical protein [Sphingomicrobium sp.]